MSWSRASEGRARRLRLRAGRAAGAAYDCDELEVTLAGPLRATADSGAPHARLSPGPRPGPGRAGPPKTNLKGGRAAPGHD